MQRDNKSTKSDSSNLHVELEKAFDVMKSESSTPVSPETIGFLDYINRKSKGNGEVKNQAFNIFSCLSPEINQPWNKMLNFKGHPEENGQSRKASSFFLPYSKNINGQENGVEQLATPEQLENYCFASPMMNPLSDWPANISQKAEDEGQDALPRTWPGRFEEFAAEPSLIKPFEINMQITPESQDSINFNVTPPPKKNFEAEQIKSLDVYENMKKFADYKNKAMAQIKPLTILKPLFELLIQAFIDQAITTEAFSALSCFEKQLLDLIFQRKFAKKLNPTDPELSVQKRVSLLNGIISSRSHKRPEECYKFVLTRAIKHFKKALPKSRFSSQNDIEDHFYEFYFKETAHSLGIPIGDFYYPLTSRKKAFRLNADYFKRVFQSKRFLADLLEYLKEGLLSDYTAEIVKKLHSLLVKWEGPIMKSNERRPDVEQEIKEYLLKNKRCKLPWTLVEVSQSIEKFQNLVQNMGASL